MDIAGLLSCKTEKDRDAFLLEHALGIQNMMYLLDTINILETKKPSDEYQRIYKDRIAEDAFEAILKAIVLNLGNKNHNLVVDGSIYFVDTVKNNLKFLKKFCLDRLTLKFQSMLKDDSFDVNTFKLFELRNILSIHSFFFGNENSYGVDFDDLAKKVEIFLARRILKMFEKIEKDINSKKIKKTVHILWLIGILEWYEGSIEFVCGAFKFGMLFDLLGECVNKFRCLGDKDSIDFGDMDPEDEIYLHDYELHSQFDCSDVDA